MPLEKLSSEMMLIYYKNFETKEAFMQYRMHPSLSLHCSNTNKATFKKPSEVNVENWESKLIIWQTFQKLNIWTCFAEYLLSKDIHLPLQNAKIINIHYHHLGDDFKTIWDFISKCNDTQINLQTVDICSKFNTLSSLTTYFTDTWLIWGKNVYPITVGKVEIDAEFEFISEIDYSTEDWFPIKIKRINKSFGFRKISCSDPSLLAIIDKLKIFLSLNSDWNVIILPKRSIKSISSVFIQDLRGLQLKGLMNINFMLYRSCLNNYESIPEILSFIPSNCCVKIDTNKNTIEDIVLNTDIINQFHRFNLVEVNCWKFIKVKLNHVSNTFSVYLKQCKTELILTENLKLVCQKDWDAIILQRYSNFENSALYQLANKIKLFFNNP